MEVGALEELLDGPDVELGWLVGPPVEVGAAVDVLCP